MTLDASDLQRRVRERVDDALVAQFQRDGAVCIRQLLTADELALLRDGIEANLAAPSPRAKVASRPDDPGRFFEDFCNWQEIDAFGRFIVEAPLAQLAQRLMGSQTVRLYHDHLLVKEPGTRQRTPWHQDQPRACSRCFRRSRWCSKGLAARRPCAARHSPCKR
ncbi:phytanoyl-CoA dioxygenase family protein, partial [Variovorax sp. YR752]|uniref:phytanoyl-CoA dioxygenase family protein n=1 Tax=Variovorax sp. YR752 TaxID=1884383 RepID=UPI0031377A5F